MPISDDFIEYCLDQLSALPSLRYKKMFGGAVVYSDEYPFALIAEDQLYFKVDEALKAAYGDMGMDLFHPYGGEQTMNYAELPDGWMEDKETLLEWAQKSIDVAVKNPPKKKEKPAARRSNTQKVPSKKASPQKPRKP